MDFHLCSDLLETASAERKREWLLSLQELNETLGDDPGSARIARLDDGAIALYFDDTRDDRGPISLMPGRLRRAMRLYRRTILRFSRSCASAAIEAGALKELDTCKRDAHDAGASALQEVLACTVDLPHPAARRLFSLLYLIWDPGAGHDLTARHHR